MHTRRPAARTSITLGLFCAVPLALASCVVLHGYPLLFVVLAAAVAAFVGYFVAPEAGDAVAVASVDAAWKAAAGTVSAIVIVTGLVVVAGGAVAAAVGGLVVVSGGLLVAFRA